MGNRYFYQPTGNREIDMHNTIIRKSSDRFEKMISFSKDYFEEPLSQKTFLDIGCSYGYFVYNFSKYCRESFGIDKDKKSFVISKMFYPQIANNIYFQNFFENNSNIKKYNIVSFLSVFQHFIVDGYDEKSLINVIKSVDETTEDILFFEMGEDHESWYKDILLGWNAEKISRWIVENTTFDFCVPLMKDEDSTEKFSNRYGRTLFACYRK